MGAKIVTFTLDDGTKITSTELSKKVGCTQGTAYGRLVSSSDPAKVFRPVNATNKGAVYVLDDGSEWTTAKLAKHLDVMKATAAARLANSKDHKRVLAPVKRNEIDERNHKKVSADMKKRMYFDPLGHWKLLNKCL
jgi:hypothetical protein